MNKLKTNIVLINTPTKQQINNIQIKIKTISLFKHIQTNNQTNKIFQNKQITHLTSTYKQADTITKRQNTIKIIYNNHKLINKIIINRQIIKNLPSLQKRQHYTSILIQYQLIHLNLHLAKHQMGSASRPRHKIKHKKYLLYHTFQQTSNTITRPIHKLIKLTQYPFKHSKKLMIHALPNLFTTSKYTLINYYKINKRKPKIKQYEGYHFINQLTLLQYGDTEPNPGPMPNVLHRHPTTHKRIANTYFISNTIKLHPEYQHLAN